MSRSADFCLRALVVASGLTLGACSSDYTDNRDSVSLQFGDAVNANKVAHTIDPWPPYAADTNIRSSGPRTAAAVERYHKGMILPPVPATTASIAPTAVAPSAGLVK